MIALYRSHNPYSRISDKHNLGRFGAVHQNSSRSWPASVRNPVFVVIWPKVPELMSRLGFPRFGWLNRLAASIRTARFLDSAMRIFLTRFASKFHAPGP